MRGWMGRGRYKSLKRAWHISCLFSQQLCQTTTTTLITRTKEQAKLPVIWVCRLMNWNGRKVKILCLKTILGGAGGNQISYGNQQGGYAQQSHGYSSNPDPYGPSVDQYGSSQHGYGAPQHQVNDEAARFASQHAPEEQDRGIFSSVLSNIMNKQDSYSSTPDDIQHAQNSHQKLYGSGGQPSGSPAEIGSAAAMQAMQDHRAAGESGGLDRFLGMAMAEAAKLFAKQQGGGAAGGHGASDSSSKSQAIQAAAMMALKLYAQKQQGGAGSHGSGGAGGSSGLGGMMSMLMGQVAGGHGNQSSGHSGSSSSSGGGLGGMVGSMLSQAMQGGSGGGHHQQQAPQQHHSTGYGQQQQSAYGGGYPPPPQQQQYNSGYGEAQSYGSYNPQQQQQHHQSSGGSGGAGDLAAKLLGKILK